MATCQRGIPIHNNNTVNRNETHWVAVTVCKLKNGGVIYSSSHFVHFLPQRSHWLSRAPDFPLHRLHIYHACCLSAAHIQAQNETIYLQEGCLANLLLLYGCLVSCSRVGNQILIQITFVTLCVINPSEGSQVQLFGLEAVQLFQNVSVQHKRKLQEERKKKKTTAPICRAHWDILSSLSIHKRSLSWELCIQAAGGGCCITHFNVFIYLFQSAECSEGKKN